MDVPPDLVLAFDLLDDAHARFFGRFVAASKSSTCTITM